tara:strand:+ start:48 stop:668 length:621 start_codon:yes stop_codon:yes gene_type:complete
MSSSGTTEKEEDIWTSEVEALLAQWSEKASCWRWLYGRAEKKYRYKYYMFSIPVIILSTLTGTANFGMDSYVPESGKSTATAIVGGLNLFAGLLSTLQNFLKVAENMESARNSCVSWGKLQRSIQIELSLDTTRRQNSHDFLKICRSEYDRLTEQSPIVDDDIISEFKKRFSEYEVSKPSICNGLDKCDIYRLGNGELEYVDDPVP